MSNQDTVLAFLRSVSPELVTNATIARRTGISPHQQVFAITQELLRRGLINGAKVDGEWKFWSGYRGVQPGDPPILPMDRLKAEYKREHQNDVSPVPELMTPNDFELLARKVMSELYDTQLEPRRIPDMPKLFDLVSGDYAVVGDAKYFAMVQGERTPPAKFSIIGEHVWLLEHCRATQKFLVFGNDVRVPREWLTRYGSLVDGIQFYFLNSEGKLLFLNWADSEAERRYVKIHGNP